MSISLISLDDAKSYLRVGATGQDARLQEIIQGATELAEKYTGKTWVQRTFTDVLSGGRTTLILTRRPVISITSVTEAARSLGAGDWTLDKHAGLLTRGVPLAPFRWIPGQANITVTYVAGVTDVPDDILTGVRRLIRHMWEDERGAGSAPRGGATTEWAEAWRNSSSIDRRAQELFDGEMTGGIA